MVHGHVVAATSRSTGSASRHQAVTDPGGVYASIGSSYQCFDAVVWPNIGDARGSCRTFIGGAHRSCRTFMPRGSPRATGVAHSRTSPLRATASACSATGGARSSCPASACAGGARCSRRTSTLSVSCQCFDAWALQGAACQVSIAPATGTAASAADTATSKTSTSAIGRSCCCQPTHGSTAFAHATPWARASVFAQCFDA